MLIPFITEPVYRSSSIWCAQTHAGIEAEISRKKYSGLNIKETDYRSFDYEKLFSDTRAPRMVVLIGTSPLWIPEALDFFAGLDIDVLLVSYQPPENAVVRGVVRIDYVSGVNTLMRHLVECDCRRPAIYACSANSSADTIKKLAFLESANNPEYFDTYGCFDNINGLAGCYESFRSHICAHEYDSVLCVNDIAAASLIKRLKADNIKVPDDVQVVCFGNSAISRLYRPSITSLLLDNIEIGRQTVSMFSYLAKSSSNVSVSVRVCGSLIRHESTRTNNSTLPVKLTRGAVLPAYSNFYEDDEVKAFTMLENLLLFCDELDYKILQLILDGITTECTAEQLSIAPETVRYRVRRILQNTGLKSRAELIDFIHGNDFGDVLSKMN